MDLPAFAENAIPGGIVPENLTDLIAELALANRILAHEGVLDAFGHVSMRHPTDPGRYLLSRSRSPLLIEPDDILESTLDSERVPPPRGRGLAVPPPPESQSSRCSISAPPGARPCRSGISTTNSATPICW